MRVQIPQQRPAVHLVLLLGSMQEQGPTYVVHHHGKGPVRELPARRGPAQHQPACCTPAFPIADIFVLTGNIGGQGRGKGRVGRGKWIQEPKERQGWEWRSRGEEHVRRREDERRDRVGDEDDCGGIDDGSIGIWRTRPEN